MMKILIILKMKILKLMKREMDKSLNQIEKVGRRKKRDDDKGCERKT